MLMESAMTQQDEKSAQGTVVGIHVAPAAGTAMHAVEEVLAVEGKGLAGDRYFAGAGVPTEPEQSGKHVTLVETEALDALHQDYGIDVQPSETRRNIATRGVSLNDLVGHEFIIGEVRLRGVELCEPCVHSVPTPKALRGLVHRGGLRADIIASGTIHVGDSVKPS